MWLGTPEKLRNKAMEEILFIGMPCILAIREAEGVYNMQTIGMHMHIILDYHI